VKFTTVLVKRHLLIGSRKLHTILLLDDIIIECSVMYKVVTLSSNVMSSNNTNNETVLAVCGFPI